MNLIIWISEKLVRKMVVSFVFFSVLAAVMTASLIYLQAQDVLQKSVVSRLRVEVDLYETELQHWIADQKQSVLFISQTSLIQSRIAELLTGAVDPPGYKRSHREVAAYLNAYLNHFADLREIMVLSNDGGEVLLSTKPEHEGVSLSNETFFLQGKKQLFVQGIYPWQATNDPTLTVSVPLLDTAGVQKGVLAVHLELDKVDEFVPETLGLDQTGGLYMVDKLKRFINVDYFGQNDFLHGVSSEGIDRAVAGEEGAGTYLNYAGEPVVGYYRWLPELEIGLIAEINQSEAFAPVRHLGLGVAGIVFLLSSMLVVGIVVVAQRITAPLQTMSDVARQVAAGDLSVQMPVVTRDETGRLAHAFNIMVSELNTAYGEMQGSVEYFRSVFQLSPDAISIQKAETGVFVKVNDNFCAMFGYPPQDVIGVSDIDLPIWQSRLERLRFAAQLQKSKQAESTANFVRKNGEIFPGLISSRLIQLENESHIVSVLLDTSILQQAEADARHKTELLQTIMNAIPAPIFFKDLAGIYQECNTALMEFVGLDYTQIVGHSVYGAAPEEKARVYEEADRKLLEQGGRQSYETQVRYADGTDRDVVFHKAVFTDPDGTVAGIVGVIFDVTDITSAQSALAESEQNYREIFNASSEAIIVRDFESGKIIDVNRAMQEMYDYSFDEALELSIADLTTDELPYSTDLAKQNFDGARAGVPQLFEWRARRKDGTSFWVEISLEKSEILGKNCLLAVVRNIEERKQTEMALIESEERFRHLFENAADALILHDDQGNIVSVNQRCCDRLGYRREELLTMTVFQIVHGADPDKMLTTWKHDIPGQSRSFERVHVHNDGSTYPVEVNVVSYDSHGRRLYIAVARDVSERKQQEAELTKYRNQLEGLVKERTSQLEDAQHELVASERLAVLGQLTATVSHELRNPLGTVKNAIYLVGRIKDGGDAEKMDKALDLADRNIRRCDNIINELLDFTRQQEGTAEEIDLGPWVQSILDEQILPYDIDLQTDLPTGCILSVNPERLRRAVINVYSNAVQSFETDDNDCKKLSIVLSSVDQRVQIVVTDNGSGISAEVMARIFEPMFSTRNFGVGLGMAIVKNIMAEQGGGVELESSPGIGTSVFLWLPQGQEMSDEQSDYTLEQDFEI